MKCTICNEQWPARTRLNLQPYVCLHCQRDKSTPKTYSKDNDMDPGEVPSCLEGMTQIEEMLIARACPIMTVYRKYGGQRGYSGHVLNLPQNIQHFLNKLPPHVSELPILNIKRMGANNTEAHFKVRRAKVLEALLWLQQNNSFYKDIEIDFDSISRLPTNGIPEDILTVITNTDTSEPPTEGPGPLDDALQNDEGNDDDDTSTVNTSFLPQPQNMQREEDAIRSAIDGQDSLDWPPLGNHNHNNSYLFTMPFSNR